MHVGDRCTFMPGSTPVDVIVRDVRDDGLVLVQNEVSGVGAYSFLVRSDFLVPLDGESRAIVKPSFSCVEAA
ncbi:hypothetical protein DK926_17425 [Rhodococcus sp. Eu-32]|nr:hypothetical protein DK926_17425 [Rhodococcus sp. Eu-32]